MIGTWNGNYRYDNKVVLEIIGFDTTGFTIIIEKFDGENFEGIVNDDVQSGGMRETGEIIGKIKKDSIYFKKLMPKNRIILSPFETRTIPEKEHPTLYYSGIFTNDKASVSGSWKFKRKFTLYFGFIPALYRPGKGTWEMQLER
ncbi:MAG: hypothetical protein EOO46_23105 [Flavobacterium sp.]|nr:MAG: hypothetical protein EOO46_23105 [Flavobacterium sp.]